MSEMVYGL